MKNKKNKNQDKQIIISTSKGLNFKKEITKQDLLIFILIMFLTLVISFSMAIVLAHSYTMTNKLPSLIFYKSLLSSIIISCIFSILYFYLRLNKNFDRWNTVLVFTVIFFTVIISSLLQAYVSPFALPIIAATFCVVVLIDKTTALLTSILLAFSMIILSLPVTFNTVILSQIVLANTLSVITGALTIFIIPKNATRFKLMWGNILIALLMLPLAFLFGFIVKNNIKDAIYIALFNLLGNILGITSSSGTIPILEYVFKIWTNLKFSEVSSFDQPILRKLAKEAPGTFQHSLAVGNMAELCAIAIGENPYIARVSGYYHDVGKLRNPEYFIENQVDGFNPHNDLIPDVSVKIITRHTVDGYNTLKEIGMPMQVAKAALEHHGTSKVQYFYNKAQSYTEGNLDETSYRYENPTPSTKISAIITICDIVEATTRSRKMTHEDLKDFIKQIINTKILENQFANCDITLKELDIICNTLVTITPSIKHTRIDYNKKEY